MIRIFSKIKYSMIVFPNAKINLGLTVSGKRSDGFHDIQSLFIPIGLKDILEVNESTNREMGQPELQLSGIPVEGRLEDNLVLEAYRLLREKFRLPFVRIALHKQIPSGAGLGGGSSDAASMIFLLDRMFDLKLSRQEIQFYLESLGSDCPFFGVNKIALVEGRGEKVRSVSMSNGKLFMVLVVPKIHVSTQHAFSLITPGKITDTLTAAIKQPLSNWKGTIVNDFEEVLFPEFPELKKIKDSLYGMGALYSSLSGSGSALYGFFKEDVDARPTFPGCYVWQEWLSIRG